VVSVVLAQTQYPEKNIDPTSNEKKRQL